MGDEGIFGSLSGGENADLILKNASILFPDEPELKTGWLITRDGIIEDTGMGEFPPFARPLDTEMYDLKGAMVLPAMCDAHMHLYQWSFSRAAVDLSGAVSLKHLVKIMKGRLTGTDPYLENTGMLLGVDYDDSLFNGTSYIDRGILDGFFPDQPVVIRRVCGHKAVVNSAALDILERSMQIPEDGILLEDDAMGVSWKMDLPLQEKRKLLASSIEEMYSLGLIAGVDIIPGNLLDEHRNILSGIENRPDLTVSVWNGKGIKGRSPPGDWDQDFKSEGEAVFSKSFMDGSIGANTASFHDDQRSSDLHTVKEMRDIFLDSLGSGLIPMVHAIGDHAFSSVLEAFDGVDGPIRIEHAESVNNRDLEKLEQPGIAICMQPNFQRVWGEKGGMYEKALGDRSLQLNRFETMFKSTEHLCFGSDMMPLGPLFGIAGATKHRNFSERIPFHRAVNLYSRKSFRLSGLLKDGGGILSPASPADLAVFENHSERSILTMKEGKVVHKHTGHV